MLLRNTVKLTEFTFWFLKILNSVNKVLSLGKMYTVIDVEAGKSVYIQYVITVVVADINNAVRLNLLKDNRQQ